MAGRGCATDGARRLESDVSSEGERRGEGERVTAVLVGDRWWGQTAGR